MIIWLGYSRGDIWHAEDGGGNWSLQGDALSFCFAGTDLELRFKAEGVSSLQGLCLWPRGQQAQAPSSPREDGAGSPDASSQDCELAREVGCPFSPTLN